MLDVRKCNGVGYLNSWTDCFAKCRRCPICPSKISAQGQNGILLAVSRALQTFSAHFETVSARFLTNHANNVVPLDFRELDLLNDFLLGVLCVKSTSSLLAQRFNCQLAEVGHGVFIIDCDVAGHQALFEFLELRLVLAEE